MQAQKYRTTILSMADITQTLPTNNRVNNPTTFREAEVLGLKLLKEEKYEEALGAFEEALRLPGSKSDVVRTMRWEGPSPVGGSIGGFNTNVVLSLDEFELQGAHYNMACAYANMENIDMAVVNLKKAFENGFDNYKIVREDPDLKNLEGTMEFDDLMEQWDRLKPFQFDFKPSKFLYKKGEDEPLSFPCFS